MSRLANAGEALAMHARLTPDKIGASDLDRRMSFRLWHQRACRLQRVGRHSRRGRSGVDGGGDSSGIAWS